MTVIKPLHFKTMTASPKNSFVGNQLLQSGIKWIYVDVAVRTITSERSVLNDK